MHWQGGCSSGFLAALRSGAAIVATRGTGSGPSGGGTGGAGPGGDSGPSANKGEVGECRGVSSTSQWARVAMVLQPWYCSRAAGGRVRAGHPCPAAASRLRKAQPHTMQEHDMLLPFMQPRCEVSHRAATRHTTLHPLMGGRFCHPVCAPWPASLHPPSDRLPLVRWRLVMAPMDAPMRASRMSRA